MVSGGIGPDNTPSDTTSRDRLGDKAMKASIYCRASTDNQEREGTSLQTQLEAAVTTAKARAGTKTVAEY